MTPDEVVALVAAGESEQLELKKSTGQRTEGAKAVCGMLNCTGGYVVFGVNDDRMIVGQEIGEGTLLSVLHELRKIEPRIPVNPEVVPINGLAVVVVSVPSNTGAIHTYEGRPYLRQGATTVLMTQDEYRRRIIEQMNPLNRWEMQPAAGFGLQDLDTEEVVRTVDEAVRRGRLNDPATRDLPDLLRGLGVVRDNVLLNAAVVLFAKSERILSAYPQCLLRMARFRGTDIAEFADSRQTHGNLFGLLQSAQSFLRDHLPVAGRVVPWSFERQDEPIYPFEALREALANAFCHRNYALAGGAVSIAIFDDRLEISSAGLLPSGLTVKALEQTHSSRPWNPIIAQTLYRRGLIEQWGRGTVRIRELTMNAGLVAPEFEERAGEMVVRFLSKGYSATGGRVLTDNEENVLRTLAELSPTTTSKIATFLKGSLSENETEEILRSLRELSLVEIRRQGNEVFWVWSR